MSILKEKGVLLDKEETKQITDKLSKRKFRLAIKESGQGWERIETPEFVLINSTCSLLDAIKEGTEIEVTFRLNGADREYKNKSGVQTTFRSTELKAFGVDIISGASAGVPADNGCTSDDYKAATRGEKFDAVTSDPSLLDAPDGDDLPF